MNALYKLCHIGLRIYKIQYLRSKVLKRTKFTYIEIYFGTSVLAVKF